MRAVTGDRATPRPSWQEETGFLLAVLTRPCALRRAAPRQRGKRACASILAVAAALLPGCGEPREQHTGNAGNAAIVVVDDVGRTVTLEQPAARIISLIPAQTDVIAALAGADVLIARTQWDEDPALAHLPTITNALMPSVEWLASRRPDLVVAWPDVQSRDVVERLTAIGIPVYASRVESVGDVRGMVQRLGTLVGRDDEAALLVARLDAQLDSVRDFVAGRPARSVLYLLSADPPMAAGAGTFIDELIRIAGGQNAFGDLRQLWPQVSLEEIVRRQPDVIIRPTERGLGDPLADLSGRSGWRELAAVQAGRVHAVDPYFYNRPGIGIGEAARGLAQRIHADSGIPLTQHEAHVTRAPGAARGGAGRGR